MLEKYVFKKKKTGLWGKYTKNDINILYNWELVIIHITQNMKSTLKENYCLVSKCLTN